MQSRLFLLFFILILLTFSTSTIYLSGLEKTKSGKPNLCEKKVISLNFSGLPNFHKVTGELYRGAQPTATGFRKLEKLGVKTIVNLRSFHSDIRKIKNTSLAYKHIFMKAWYPEEEDVIRFLKIVTNKMNMPVFVHCQFGADRTGVMTAMYRIIICGWTKKQAIKEMTKGGYGFHKIWANLVQFIKNIDLDDIKRKVGEK